MMSRIFYLLPWLLFSTDSLAHGISEEAKIAMLEGGYLRYVWLGAEHMVTGYDHLLFLLGVIFFLTRFRDVVIFISVFTLGHSITLIAATFAGITANYWLVDAVIALSVCYKGFDNNKGFENYLGMQRSPNLIFMVFIFGLIHGFGLSTRLQQLPLGDTGVPMLMRIVSFNVGVELGQIAALTVMLFLLSRLRHTDTFKKLSRAINDGLIVTGFMLLIMQLHGYLHTTHPEEFNPAEHHQEEKSSTEDKEEESQQHKKRKSITATVRGNPTTIESFYYCVLSASLAS